MSSPNFIEGLEDRRLFSGTSCPIAPVTTPDAPSVTTMAAPLTTTATRASRAKRAAARVNLVGIYHGTWTETVANLSGTIDVAITAQDKRTLTGTATIHVDGDSADKVHTYSQTIKLPFTPRPGKFRVSIDRLGIKGAAAGTLDVDPANNATHLVGTFTGRGFGIKAAGSYDISRVS